MNLSIYQFPAQGETSDHLQSTDGQALWAAEFSPPWDETRHLELMAEIFGDIH